MPAGRQCQVLRLWNDVPLQVRRPATDTRRAHTAVALPTPSTGLCLPCTPSSRARCRSLLPFALTPQSFASNTHAHTHTHTHTHTYTHTHSPNLSSVQPATRHGSIADFCRQRKGCAILRRGCTQMTCLSILSTPRESELSVCLPCACMCVHVCVYVCVYVCVCLC